MAMRPVRQQYALNQAVLRERFLEHDARAHQGQFRKLQVVLILDD